MTGRESREFGLHRHVRTVSKLNVRVFFQQANFPDLQFQSHMISFNVVFVQEDLASLVVSGDDQVFFQRPGGVARIGSFVQLFLTGAQTKRKTKRLRSAHWHFLGFLSVAFRDRTIVMIA
jgi:hypothetical protein